MKTAQPVRTAPLLFQTLPGKAEKVTTMNSLSQRVAENKAPFQLDLFAAPSAPTAPSIVPSADPLISQSVRLPADPCKCGSENAVIGTGTETHHARLHCRSCGRFRGWLSKFTADSIEAVAAKFGAPETITIKGPKL
jgi:hypothetical protein